MRPCAWILLFCALEGPLQAQFKEIGPPPFSQPIAHQKIRKLLETVDSGNRKQTVATLSGWVAWFREILDEELISAWQTDSRANLPEVIDALSTERVAVGVVAFSWREQRSATFTLTYAPMFTSLMSRYPNSAAPFLRDLLGREQEAAVLTEPVAEAVCRILIDMPEVGTWKENAMQILPHYREAAKTLLAQDLHASNEDKLFRAEMWMSELKMNSAVAAAPSEPSRRRGMAPSPVFNAGNEPVSPQRRVHVDGPPVPVETEARQPRTVLPSTPAPVPAYFPAASPAASPATQVPLIYNGPSSGTYESNGAAIPQNAEFVFRNVPSVKMRLDYDTKIWEARLVPGEGKTQRLLVRNKSAGPQKHCVVHWTLIP